MNMTQWLDNIIDTTCRKALEEAARTCEAEAERRYRYADSPGAGVAEGCAAAIRALIDAQPATIVAPETDPIAAAKARLVVSPFKR